MANLMTSRLSGGGDGPERLSLRPPSCSPSCGKAVGHGVRLRSPHKTPTWFALPRSGSNMIGEEWVVTLSSGQCC